MDEVQSKPKLEVQDKSLVFITLLSRMDRLLLRNPFPVADTMDFALSLLTPDEEAAWRTLFANKRLRPSLSFNTHMQFRTHEADPTPAEDSVPPRTFTLHYRGDKHGKSIGSDSYHFPTISQKGPILVPEGSRYVDTIRAWAERQIALEDRLLEGAFTLKRLVQRCNTVGQWQRAAPALVTFLPEKYKLHLRHYEKRAPLPDLELPPENIKRLYAMQAMAQLLEPASDERTVGIGYRGRPVYNLGLKWWSSFFHSHVNRKLER